MKSSYFILLILFFIACTTVELPIDMGQEAKPIFELTGTINNKPITFTAGIENKILSTDLLKRTYQVIELKGIIRNQACNIPCNESFTLKLRENSSLFLSSGSTSLVGTRPFYRLVPIAIGVKTMNTSILPNSANGKYLFDWTINGRQFSEKENIVYESIDEDLSTICLNITHSDGSKASQCQVIDLNLLDTFPGLKVNLLTELKSNKTWQLVPRIFGLGPFKIAWDNNNQDSVWIIDQKQASDVCIRVYDSKSNVASECINLNPEGKIKCKSDFAVSIDRQRLRELIQYHSVEFSYIDINGKEWSTAFDSQPAISSFEILESTDYQLNDKKQNTKKLKIKLQAQLFTAQGESQIIRLAGTMGVAVPY
ncbi:MAG: hypothetical protein ABI844_09125 [Saprospiraceae bacterium]